jgi:hypothetical protein
LKGATGEHQLGRWLQSGGETKKTLSQKQVIYLSNEGHRCLIAVGDAPGQKVGSVVFSITAGPNTRPGNEKPDPAIWRTYGGDK